ncbi:hypothetical protein BP5796_06375 [Coleophoma crateriformis]|uniref:Amine oxidase domain-containing protein n=1 Tax=Coleophoma crateriformis TaxID=565419 RepID=A0A3D8RNS9_9HELO|nr:hypothetical protein BP5796_06375 [Coleophoma crateriformis]
MAPLTHRSSRKRVAIVGSGVAGIGALWALNRTPHDVYIYEAADRLGGHTNTVEYRNGKYKTNVDTGFIVLNSATYPNFLNFLRILDVPFVPTEMTFGVSRDQGLFEWSGTSLSAVFTQRRNIFSLRVEEKSEEFSTASNGVHHSEEQETIGEYLEREGYSDAFRDDYLIPMTAAVWSTSPDKCSLEFPAVTLVRFMWNHHLLSTVAARPQWMTLKNGSQSYIDAVMKGFPPNHIFLNTAVDSITNDEDGRVRLHLANGREDVYDHVILATHGDEAFSIIRQEADREEREVFSGFQTSENIAVLHSDLSLMPKSKGAWASWNYITESSPTSSNIDQVCLTYNMNILQHIPRDAFGDVLVTLNPLHYPKRDTVQGHYNYRHPLYTAAAIRSQSLLPRIQNTRGISYCGAWTKYGFHEDGFSSGIKVAHDHLGASLPFKFKDSTFSRGKRPVLGLADLILRVWISAMQTIIVLLERLMGIERGLQRNLSVQVKKLL